MWACVVFGKGFSYFLGGWTPGRHQVSWWQSRLRFSSIAAATAVAAAG